MKCATCGAKTEHDDAQLCAACVQKIPIYSFIIVRSGSNGQLAKLLNRRFGGSFLQVRLRKWRANSKRWTLPNWYSHTDVIRVATTKDNEERGLPA